MTRRTDNWRKIRNQMRDYEQVARERMATNVRVYSPEEIAALEAQRSCTPSTSTAESTPGIDATSP